MSCCDIIGFSGRMGSGKGVLASVCEKHGYKRLSFATPLKKLCAKILSITLDELIKFKNNGQPINLMIDDNICKLIADETGLSFDKIKIACGDKKIIATVREMLQFIGTDVIRQIDENWHVRAITEMINHNEKYVIDDIRFPNELAALNHMNATCWYVVRPTIIRLTHHPAEESLKWHMFGNKVIVNDSSLENLEKRWDDFMENYERNIEIRNDAFSKAQSNDELLISDAFFSYKPRGLNALSVKTFTLTSNGTLIIEYCSDPTEIITNPLVIEDLKIYL